MKRDFISAAVLIPVCSVVQAQKVDLLPAVDPAGYIARLLVNEVPFPGEDDYATRDQVGRVLFNCMALGRKVRIEK